MLNKCPKNVGGENEVPRKCPDPGCTQAAPRKAHTQAAHTNAQTEAAHTTAQTQAAQTQAAHKMPRPRLHTRMPGPSLHTQTPRRKLRRPRLLTHLPRPRLHTQMPGPRLHTQMPRPGLFVYGHALVGFHYISRVDYLRVDRTTPRTTPVVQLLVEQITQSEHGELMKSRIIAETVFNLQGFQPR